MESPALQKFFQTIQKASLPGIWTKAIALARDNLVQIDSWTGNEVVLKVRSPDKAVSLKVNLWLDDEDYFCDCEGRVEPCAHVAAAVVALKGGLKLETVGSATSGSASGKKASKTTPTLRYKFIKQGSILFFQRLLGDVPLTGSLVALIGGAQSGRLTEIKNGGRIAATQEDFAIDRALGEAANVTASSPAVRLDRATLLKLLPILRQVSPLELDQRPVVIGPPTRGLHAEVQDDGPGLRVVGMEDHTITEVFENGVLLTEVGGIRTLRVLEDPGLTSFERQMLKKPGRWFSAAEMPKLLSEIIPALEKKLPVRMLAKKIPHVSYEVSQSPPRIVLNLEKTGEHVMTVTPSLVYSSEYAVRDSQAEQLLMRKLQAELHLSLGHRAEFRGMSAVEFVRRAQDWELAGNGVQQFALRPTLVPEFSTEGLDFDITFKASALNSSNHPSDAADTAQVFQAWLRHETHVPILGGGYAPLPMDWLARYGSRIQRLLAFREKGNGHLPAYLLPELANIHQELTGAQREKLAGAKGARNSKAEDIAEVPAVNEALDELKRKFEDFEGIAESPLPKDLQAELRHYQRQGVNWLQFLKKNGMGALLADDMGLGKTIQALCVLKEKEHVLVVAPTSVLHSWEDQLKKFRPKLKVALYYGSNRTIDPTANITITSYGLLRQDKEALLSQKWDGAILDEAQMIKNPESQIAQASHLLGLHVKDGFRLTLSGTPVENRMEDLWSQFEFLNPGLLGSRREFQDDFGSAISRGDEIATSRLRSRIRPFILRRLKKDVAPELPPRTEVVLNCELSPTEREIYDTLLASARAEVMETLEEGGSVLGALELLLRLRQACCHPDLVPGQKAESSSKVDLLAQSLENSIAQGHRALVFSQWTSFLDLIEPRLEKMGLPFLRLDGSTNNREEVVRNFQDPNGPPVMLLSLKAGGVGLTLTAADHVYLMDSWWNPAVEDQAADRVHRIGQENPVLICRLITENTVEERILSLQKRKQELSNSILAGGAQAASLTRADIMALLN
jgi:SNF2-related domain/Helicase conserved C-terminal domain